MATLDGEAGSGEARLVMKARTGSRIDEPGLDGLEDLTTIVGEIDRLVCSPPAAHTQQTPSAGRRIRMGDASSPIRHNF